MRRKYFAVLLVLLALALPAAPADAAGVVNSCDEAHLLAALAGGGTVTFTCSGTITLTAEITISSDTTIDGSGQAVTISGGSSVRVFEVNSGATLNLNHLTVANGSSDKGGGGIYNWGTATVSNCIFSGHHATNDGDGMPDFGGGIGNAGTLIVSNSTFSFNHVFGGGGIANAGTATVSNSTFFGNSATEIGGGIQNSGSLTVSNSTFSGNYGNSANYGGAIYNSGTATVSNSTFSGNRANGGGGAIYSWVGALAVSNSTFFGNHATEFGGGIFNEVGTATVSNCTFSGNDADLFGGGIANSGTATLKNTIVANSVGVANCTGVITDGGGNLSYGDATCPGINGDPRLGPLQDNGGPTQTLALLPGSAALDAANDAICAAAPVNNLDQRGVARPQGPHCDIGAYELLWPPVTSLRAGNRPTADGDLAEWQPLGQTLLNKDTAATITGAETHPTLADLSAGLRSAWTPDRLYFAAAISDDVLVGNNSPNPWNDDVIELGIRVGDSTHQFIVALDGRQTDLGNPITSLTVATHTVTGGWSLEVEVPVAALGLTQLTAGQSFPFTFGLWDDDLFTIPGQTHMIWQGSSTYTYQSQWGMLVLSGDVHDFPLPNTPTPTATPTASATPTATASATASLTGTPRLYLPLLLRGR